MRNLLKKVALVAAVAGTAVYAFAGCGLVGNWPLFLAYLNEDVFG